MQLLFVASESVPFVKTGGLGDVVGALPLALAKLGHGVTLVLPLYRAVRDAIGSPPVVATIEVPLGGRQVRVSLREAEASTPGFRVLLVDQPDLFDRGGLYQDETGTDFPDNCERFALLCRAAFEAAVALELPVDCFHAHDWQAGLVPVYLTQLYRETPRFANTGCLFTIHNIAFQGMFEPSEWPTLGLDGKLFSTEGLEHHRRLCLIKGGIVFADAVSTVSETYAKEIQTKKSGHGLDQVLRRRTADLVGIVNGIDVEAWNPATDRALPVRYAPETQAHRRDRVSDPPSWAEAKRVCKRSLREQVGLPERGDRPLIGMVGRLTEHKGIDLLGGICSELHASGVQLVVLGTGEDAREAEMRDLARRYPESIAVRLQFDETLARRIYAGADMFLMPSQFEPCGLTQLYSFRYGTVPIVRAVGGLADTVVDATSAALTDGTATGFTFAAYTPEALLAAVRRALDEFEQPEQWRRIVDRGMSRDWSWENSARRYVQAYEQAIARAGEMSGG